jgi:hypothetical protein
MGKPPNEMGDCPFASPLVTPLEGIHHKEVKSFPKGCFFEEADAFF